MGRGVLAVVVGFVAGNVFNMALIMVSQAVFPLPEGVDSNDMEAFRQHLETEGMPTGALLLTLVAHAGGSLVSGLVCGLIAGRTWYAAAIGLGLVFTGFGGIMIYLLPAPLWFAAADLLLYVPAALLGMKLGGRSKEPAAQS